MHMSPGVLATMWKEAETKTRLLEDKMKQLLKERGVSYFPVHIYIYIYIYNILYIYIYILGEWPG